MSWPLVNLESVAHINPRLPKGTDESQVVTFLKMASVSEGGELLEQEKRILSETKKGFTYFEKDDVLLAKITPCFENGKAALLDDLETPLGFGSTEFHVLRAAEGKLDSKYLFHLVWNEEFRFLGKHAMKGAAGQQRISTDFLKNLKIPLPPLETQKQIAAVLEKADQLRKDCQQMERELNGLAQSVFIDMFGDPVMNPKGFEVMKLKDLVSVLSGA
ncbi:restriction endonuclease subunit S, partial [Vibrio sp. 10N.222.55.E8]